MEPDAPRDPTPVDELPAFDRTQTRPSPVPPPEPIPRGRVAALVALVAVGLAIAYALLRVPTADEGANLLASFVDATASYQAAVETTRPEEARAFVLDQLGWDVPPPDLPALALVGVDLPVVGSTGGGAPSARDVVVPRFRYSGAGGETAYVYAYDYITLDQVRASFDLPDATYALLGEDVPVDTRRLEGAYIVTWRRRSMIFTAVTDSEEAFEQIGQWAASL
ncbi:hypothetical protein RQM47_09590 [Rubrivirga sp. S365]|uniref:hypothetical protein n=1 Tax=Rubrivirga sp. S365 TaxID=3076080 RepID=UPI0028C9FB35|nr:hypothetical protein [Rubrivirga sp. S365]MDT7856891.1 hypothetical protein [Rubrivirga sp. S365]